MARLVGRCVPFVATALLGMLLAGCSTFFTGGGWLPSVVPAQKATVAFEFRCDASGQGCSSGHARGTYTDKAAGVQFMFDGILNATGPTIFGNNCFEGTMAYTVPGGRAPAGTVEITACDNGQPGQGSDHLDLAVEGGPYDGYANKGILQGGNFKAH
jgi:hypothetical protein